MNELVRLRGNLIEKKNNTQPGAPKFSKQYSYCDSKMLEKIKNDLQRQLERWEKEKIINGYALISVFYNRIVPKSKRIRSILYDTGKKANDMIKGIRYSEDRKHIITYYISIGGLKTSISRIDKSIKILDEYFDSKITNDELDKLDENMVAFKKYEISKSVFNNIVTDAVNIERIDTIKNDKIENDNIISLYDLDNLSVKELLEKLKISDYEVIDDNTIRLKSLESYNRFMNEAGYLVSMQTTDITKIDYRDFVKSSTNETYQIRDPKNEPVIGVIDTLFDKNVYFSKWVEYRDMLAEGISKNEESYIHGTAVTSLIVDGARLNPQYDDGCGNFRVRHFGVATKGKNSAITIMKLIRQIVEENSDIHVWNLSLGSELEINDNFVSLVGSLLDKLQYEKNIVFVVAGTNDNGHTMKKKIGSPADSINSIVVNALDFDGNEASYSRKGEVLSFFHKPDIAYYGGDKGKHFLMCTGTGAYYSDGTSFAAPWIARKMAYMIDVLGFTRETAKALLIDSATDWNGINEKKSPFIGFGKVPVRIEDVVDSKNDEIKFYIEGISSLYETYTHNIPIPMYKDKYPFIAKATLCYFPDCDRMQGVDYTQTELDVYFGRINNKGNIQSINENQQSEGESSGINEEEARKYFRKWDNVKHISQILKKGSRAKSQYSNPMWGLNIKSKQRTDKNRKPLRFSIVITLKELGGVNRIDEFINQCSLRGWLVNKVNIENNVDVYNIAEQELKFDVDK